MKLANSIRRQSRKALDRVHARLAGLARPATGFVLRPEPRSVGRPARGRQLLAGNLMFAGVLVEARDRTLWEAMPEDPAFAAEAHGFLWLDDLAAVGDAEARALAQEWTTAWIGAFGRGTGPGWTAELAGRRMIRLVHHALFLLRGRSSEESRRFFEVLGRHTIFLSRRWRSAPPGLPRFEAAAGFVYAAISLTGMERHIERALEGLESVCRTDIDDDGAIATRNPEELLEIFAILTWVEAALTETGRRPGPDLRAAIERVAPTMRTLRHADGGLARFHGGGRGIEGRLDSALSAAGVRQRRLKSQAMGFARLSGGRSSVLIDAAPPPRGAFSTRAHASTLAFELTSGRRPLVVSCGPGSEFGPEWRRASRATPMHSTLVLEGMSSARLGAAGGDGPEMGEELEFGPTEVPAEVRQSEEGMRFEGAHDGYAASHGLTHARILEMPFDGSALIGEDLLVAVDPEHERIFDAALDRTGLAGIPFDLRFHLHPDAEATLDLGGQAVSITLGSGEVWVFRFQGKAELSLEPSVHLERGRLKPRATMQVVLTGRALEYATRVRWSLAKADETPLAVRDVFRGEVEPVPEDEF